MHLDSTNRFSHADGFGTSNADQSQNPMGSLVYIGREAIVDEDEDIVAYKLSFRDARPYSHFPQDYARLIVDAYSHFGLKHLLGRKLGYLHVPEELLRLDILLALPPEGIVLEVEPNGPISEEFVKSCFHLRSKGYRLAINNVSDVSSLGPLLPAISTMILDVDKPNFELLAQFYHGQMELLARGVHSRSDFARCMNAGFKYFQGSFFAHPDTLNTTKVDPSKFRVMELFNLVMKRADVSIIEKAFKQDAALILNLLRFINSAFYGFSRKIDSIRHAIAIVGYDPLWRWLSLLIYSGVGNNQRQQALLHTALIRGRFIELIGQMILSEKESNHLFIVGVFSLLDTLLNMPIDKAVANLCLTDEVANALVHQKGKYAPFLHLALAFEQDDFARAEELCKILSLDLTKITQEHFYAIEWAEQQMLG